MNRIGGKSNTGEGGEDPKRYRQEQAGQLSRMAIPLLLLLAVIALSLIFRCRQATHCVQGSNRSLLVGLVSLLNI
jgi:hypothetical protein